MAICHPQERQSSHSHHQSKLPMIVKLVILLHMQATTHSQPLTTTTTTHSHSHHVVRSCLYLVKVEVMSTPLEETNVEQPMRPKHTLMAIAMQLPMSEPQGLAHVPVVCAKVPPL